MGRRAHGVDTPMAYALHARCRGMVEATFDRRFERALQLDDERPMPFERARTLLAYGRRLHRVGRRAEARKPLHVAVASFERLGAAPWLASAAAELRAAGGRRRSATGSRDQLTVSERRVAATVARGLTNREVAAELFLSPKTVEFHLGQIYRKLGVRSRTQLAAVLKDRAAGEPAARP
jgi:DNA-binding CsgD family transcriptional regulator